MFGMKKMFLHIFGKILQISIFPINVKFSKFPFYQIFLQKIDRYSSGCFDGQIGPWAFLQSIEETLNFKAQLEKKGKSKIKMNIKEIVRKF